MKQIFGFILSLFNGSETRVTKAPGPLVLQDGVAAVVVVLADAAEPLPGFVGLAEIHLGAVLVLFQVAAKVVRTALVGSSNQNSIFILHF